MDPTGHSYTEGYYSDHDPEDSEEGDDEEGEEEEEEEGAALAVAH